MVNQVSEYVGTVQTKIQKQLKIKRCCFSGNLRFWAWNLDLQIQIFFQKCKYPLPSCRRVDHTQSLVDSVICVSFITLHNLFQDNLRPAVWESNRLFGVKVRRRFWPHAYEQTSWVALTESFQDEFCAYSSPLAVRLLSGWLRAVVLLCWFTGEELSGCGSAASLLFTRAPPFLLLCLWLLLSRADSITVADHFPRVSEESWLESVMRGVEAAAARAAVWHPACDGLTRASCPVSRVNQVEQSAFVPVCRCVGLQWAVDVFGSVCTEAEWCYAGWKPKQRHSLQYICSSEFIFRELRQLIQNRRNF